ncbi:hypothetical protein [Bradyrhizobium sp. G127]|jgi:formate-dependent phosphoribosylglycinamide formyltransferase (GAR transformylase)|uniref:hypothetical protein n=1 Tax=Bradyrhizobium sp. G127 TaxID=2904800 RepID=UPI001F39F5C8|nr:hypothetical protein [Bradyrhizobium sp. G127]MCF2523511.1 hypothetical protein [Bradyrhizobium sp. G127]
MKNAIPIALIALLLSAPAALAQSKSGTTTSGVPEARGIPQAPIGHRQPRADQVPSAQEKNYTESAEDKALDRKIKSICRGC